MDLENAHLLSNDFRRVQLCSLHRWPEAATIAPPESGGPFLILQTAIDPEDARATVEEFVLSRHGRWLPFYLFTTLPKEVRREEFLFAVAADAIAVLQGLTGKPVIERGTPASTEAEAPEDSLLAAVEEARCNPTPPPAAG